MNNKHFVLTSTTIEPIINPNNSLYNRNFYIKVILIFSSMFILFMFCSPDTYGANLGKLTDTLKAKIDDVTKVIEGIAKAGVGMGLLWFIVSLIRGEPQYRYAFLLVLAGCLLYTASHITKWAIGA